MGTSRFGTDPKLSRVKHAIDVAPFDDHIVYRAPVRAVADPWVALAAVACATSTLRIGPLVTPPSRRRVHKLARETVTLDLLSSGRLTLGVGLGSARNGELEPFGEVADPRERARLLDQPALGWPLSDRAA
jgi:alkanesulfonate monooxygenase SsuD/methylene tetrahydromethanopterin reductase-like flavin-dependent oxidoreductase (luciferase family)